jgi:uncharacterized protein (DUF1499 family)
MKLSRVALGTAVLAVLLLGAAGPSYRLGASLPTAFTILRAGAYVGLAAVALGLVSGIVSYGRHERGAMLLSLAAFVLGLIAVGIPYFWRRRAERVPPIHDISTDLDNPPAFEAIVALRAGAPNSLERPPDLAEQQRQGYPELAPVTLPLALDEAYSRALAAAQAAGWEIVSADPSSGRIEATDTTGWFGFKDDVVVRLTPSGTGTRVDVRSVSRVGRSDVGTNARRIERYLEDLQSR